LLLALWNQFTNKIFITFCRVEVLVVLHLGDRGFQGLLVEVVQVLVAERHAVNTHLVCFGRHGDLSHALQIVELRFVLVLKEMVLRVDLGVTLTLENKLTQNLDFKGFLVGILPHDTL
jgi:hypothetical protein